MLVFMLRLLSVTFQFKYRYSTAYYGIFFYLEVSGLQKSVYRYFIKEYILMFGNLLTTVTE